MNISVIIPVYNAEKYIVKAIESCLQFSEVKEIIVVDDGYKDGAKELVRELSKKHQIIKLYEHPNNENKGAGPSRNLGIEKSTSEYIAFLDADDFFLPNRFIRDKQVFQEFSDAHGCYNALGCYFYSEKARKSFIEHFDSTTTTVNSAVNPTPDNLLKGLLGLIPDFGYFSLDGLTVKKSFIIDNNIQFPSLSVHQDTVFIIKLAYYGKLYPSEIDNPVTLRGVHEENRIVANYNLAKKKHFKRFEMWQLLYNWAKPINIGKKEFKLIKNQKDFYKILSEENSRTSDVILLAFSDFRVLLNPDYRKLIKEKFKM
ncbi:MAG: glycosyltransferase family 2 protein [Tissierellia bacterium]|nr:glycosyltransferase family 2 protein [Tissierellia bacterium]MDD4781041.1 glycosyltransferase family 2 protein [Tissierellia bacterium]